MEIQSGSARLKPLSKALVVSLPQWISSFADTDLKSEDREVLGNALPFSAFDYRPFTLKTMLLY